MPESPDSSLHRAASPLETRIGLFAGATFRLASGRCLDCAAIPQALWYFADETIAAPRPGLPVAGFTRSVSVWQDVEQWAVTHPPGTPIDAPPLVWIGSPEIVRGASLSPDGATLAVSAKRWSFALVPKIPLNRSYYNAASTAYLAPQTLTVRGSSRDGVFTARTLWPEDFRLDSSAPSQRVDATPEAVRALVRAEPRGGAQSPFAAIPLWERSPGSARRWEGAPVLAVILNGAQGDDDEAHGGHFALVTGRVGAAGTPGGPGAISDWITNNFYTLDAESEKGIIAAMLPLDNYLADLNSGQAWYRPSYLIVAVLKRERVASQVQGALERTYNQFYRHQLLSGMCPRAARPAGPLRRWVFRTLRCASVVSRTPYRASTISPRIARGSFRRRDSRRSVPTCSGSQPAGPRARRRRSRPCSPKISKRWYFCVSRSCRRHGSGATIRS